jgi:hypothetical protein
MDRLERAGFDGMTKLAELLGQIETDSTKKG